MQRITKDPETRRQEIVDTAIHLFIEKGYEQTSMLDITKSINVSSGLCYRYFKSKEEIYQAALETYVSQGVDYFVFLLGDKKRSIIDMIDNMPSLDSGNEKASPYHEFFNAGNHSNFHLQMEIALINRLIPIVSERLEWAKANGEIEIENPISFASFYLYGQLGIWQMKDLDKEVKKQEIRNYLKKLLGI
ncbi:MAG: TetR/AcrR family transcriptional regulator [Paludibacter sp.]|nr:TetR/AcrR family transcriptional regulator [Paludibacter sp.]